MAREGTAKSTKDHLLHRLKEDLASPKENLHVCNLRNKARSGDGVVWINVFSPHSPMHSFAHCRLIELGVQNSGSSVQAFAVSSHPCSSRRGSPKLQSPNRRRSVMVLLWVFTRQILATSACQAGCGWIAITISRLCWFLAGAFVGCSHWSDRPDLPATHGWTERHPQWYPKLEPMWRISLAVAGWAVGVSGQLCRLHWNADLQQLSLVLRNWRSLCWASSCCLKNGFKLHSEIN